MKDLMKLDLYELLNIKITASESEIKKAYRKKALTCHPDKNPDDPKADEDFKQLTKAVEILTNDYTRAEYDKLLRQRKRTQLAVIIRISNREKALAKKAERKAAREAAREKEEAKRKKQYKEKEEEKRKGCLHKKDTKRTVPTWPPSASTIRISNGCSAFRRYMKNIRKECDSRKKKEKTIPTWPPTSPKSDSEIEEKMNSSFSFNFTPIVRPATFVAPSSTEFKNLWKGSSSPIIKPAKFIAPSNSKNSDGFHSAHQNGSSPILKPATFVAPSMN